MKQPVGACVGAKTILKHFQAIIPLLTEKLLKVK